MVSTLLFGAQMGSSSGRGYEVTHFIGGENDKFKDADEEYLCYMNLLNVITETVDHKCGKEFCPAGTLAPSVPGTPRVMHGTLERDPNNMANLPRKKTMAKKTVPRKKAVRLGSVVDNVNMVQVMGDMTVSQVMGDVTVSQVVGYMTIGGAYDDENVIFKKKAGATKKYKRKNTEANEQHQPSIMKKNDNVEVVGEVPIWEEGLVENEWYDNACIENEQYDNDMGEDNADEGGHDDDMGEDDANVGEDNDDEGGHDVDMGWDMEDNKTQDDDGIPNEEDIRRCEMFGDFLNGANNIFEEEEDVFKLQPQTNYESLHVGMDWPTVSKAREYLRKFTILNKFETKQVKNESYRIRYKYALKNVFPHQNHRFYFRHMWKNFKKDFRGSYLERLCWGTAKAFVRAGKQVFLEKIRVDNPKAKRWLDKEPAEYWCRAKIHIDRMKRLYNEYGPQGSDFNSLVVISKDGKQWKLYLEERTCDCNEWYCSKYHMVSSYVKTYNGSVLAISDLSLWDKKTCKGPPAEPRPKGSQPITIVRREGRSRGNRPRDSFGPRSGVASELPTHPTVLTLIGIGGISTNVRGRGSTQIGRVGVPLLKLVGVTLKLEEVGEATLKLEDEKEATLKLEEVGEASLKLEEVGKATLQLEEVGETTLKLEEVEVESL
ncbi:hypothetical protein GIB67_042519 [Kingdonia uniflora]|uniref:Transposase MuDR plant domain-containing protein n=1 Tax=Kingdonia uniflora TaxID=39325 RepID=A0A7J7M171_9MAGN|nr:hypothetical protein GIB67_042519 [Kingdonia uniflora]